MGTSAGLVPKPGRIGRKTEEFGRRTERRIEGAVWFNHARSGAYMTRTHDPLAMQKVVGSSPIIRF
jgi:hypothetical protein